MLLLSFPFCDPSVTTGVWITLKQIMFFKSSRPGNLKQIFLCEKKIKWGLDETRVYKK